jgi:hypothetical protein
MKVRVELSELPKGVILETETHLLVGIGADSDERLHPQERE